MHFRVIALLTAAISFGHFTAALKSEEPAILRDWIAAQQRIGDVSVPFKLTRTLPSLKAPIVSDGHFWRMGDGRFRWELGVPPATILLYDGSGMNLWEASNPKWQALSPNEGRMRMWMHFLNSKELTVESMTQDFTATITGEDRDAVTVALQPKGVIVRRHLKQVDLQIHPTTFHLRQVRLIQSDGSTVLMSFSKPQPFTDTDKRNLSFKPTS